MNLKIDKAYYWTFGGTAALIAIAALALLLSFMSGGPAVQ